MGPKQTVSVRVFVESSLAGSGLQRLRLKGNNVLDLLYYEQSLCLWCSDTTEQLLFELPGQRHHRSEALVHTQCVPHTRGWSHLSFWLCSASLVRCWPSPALNSQTLRICFEAKSFGRARLRSSNRWLFWPAVKLPQFPHHQTNMHQFRPGFLSYERCVSEMRRHVLLLQNQQNAADGTLDRSAAEHVSSDSRLLFLGRACLRGAILTVSGFWWLALRCEEAHHAWAISETTGHTMLHLQTLASFLLITLCRCYILELC